MLTIPDTRNLISRRETQQQSDVFEGPLKLPVHHSTIVNRGFRGILNVVLIMPRDANLSDSYTRSGVVFQVWYITFGLFPINDTQTPPHPLRKCQILMKDA